MSTAGKIGQLTQAPEPPVTWQMPIVEAERLRRHEKVIQELKLYFTSGNSVPVERATIMAVDFWKIVGDL